MTEEWRPVVGFEGAYEVSSFGTIRSLARDVIVHRSGGQIIRRLSGQRIAPHLRPDGYSALPICINGIKHRLYVHRIVCEAFHGPCPVGHEVAHNDGNRSNNCASNLRWATRRDNHADKIGHGTQRYGERIAWSKLTECAVREIRAGSSTINDLAEKFGVSSGTVSKVRNGQRWRFVA